MIDFTPAPEDPSLSYLLCRATSALRPQVSAELRQLGLGILEFECMRYLAISPGQSGAQLARNANVSPQAIHLVLHRLQNIGAITRPAKPISGKTLPARLTVKGIAMLQHAGAVVHRTEDRLLTHLAPGDRHVLKQLLGAVTCDE